MRTVPHDELRQRFQQRQANGDKVDDRVLRRLGTATIFREVQLRDREEFLRLIWQTLEGKTHILAPPGHPRTLKDVAFRALQRGYSISRLGSQPPINAATHDPAWFAECIRIDSAFDYAHFWEVILVDPNDHELRESPFGGYYLHDGNHKALVLAMKILAGKIRYEPISALHMSPREVNE